MSNLNDIISNMMKGAPQQRSRRQGVSKADIEERLAYYEETTEGFSVTGEHLAAAKAIFCDTANVFVTGGAGTGKTSFIRTVVIPELNHRGLNFAVTATTGVAGSLLDGKTLHSWAGIGLGPYFPPTIGPPQDLRLDRLMHYYEETYDEWVNTKKMSPKARAGIRKRVQGTEVLLLDEVSMCAGAALLGYLDYFFKKVRNREDAPFGGLQMIFVGDFCQLPPVEKDDTSAHADWAFLSSAWKAANVRTVELTRVFRQADQKFAGFLNQIRLGQPVDPNYLTSFVKTLTPAEAIQASYLVPTNAQADRINRLALERYPAPTVEIPAQFVIEPTLLESYEDVPRVKQQLLQGKVIKEVLELREGLPVMLTVNDPEGAYVNGTKAFVRSFERDSDGQVAIVKVGIPLKTPGPEGMENLIRVGRRFTTRNQKEDADELTQIYEAERDVVTEEELIAARASDNPNAEEQLRKRRHDAAFRTTHQWPVLKQFPLIPATGVTVHKAQGSSLDECVVDLKQSFAPGHVYVAMSRLRTAAGLTLTSTDFRIRVDRDVMEFYRALRA